MLSRKELHWIRVGRYKQFYSSYEALKGGWIYQDLVDKYLSEDACKNLLNFIKNKSKTETSTLLKTHLLELNHIVNRKLIKLKKHN